MGQGKGKASQELDTEVLFDLIEKGARRKDIAQELGMSAMTLSRRITEIQEKQGLVLQYRALQNIQLTEIQATVLDAITADKIEEAPLRDLVFAYKVLKEKELVEVGKPTELKGMMHYLIELEKQELAGKTNPEDVTELNNADIIDVGDSSVIDDLTKEMPNL